MEQERVIECKKVREWNGKPIYSVGLSDGRGGESFAVEIPIGTPVSDLIIEEDPKYGLKFKLKSKSGGGGGFKRQEKGNESFALAYSKDVLIASWSGAKAPKIMTTADMFLLADKCFNWLESKRKAFPKPQEQPKQEPVKQAPVKPSVEEWNPNAGLDTLPF